MDQFLNKDDSGLIDSLAESVRLYPVPAPKATILNRSAGLAALGDNPAELVPTYRALVAEGERGEKGLRDSLTARLNAQSQKDSFNTVMGILADPKQSPANKQEAINYQRKPESLNVDNALLRKAIVAPVEKDNAEAEDVRVSISASIQENEKSRNEMQTIVNAFGAALPSANAGTLLDMAEATVMPFATNISTAKIVTQLNKELGRKVTMGDFVKAIALPGSYNKEFTDALDNASPEEKIRMTKALAKVLQENSSIIIPGDNNFVKFERITKMTEGYSNADMVLDNLSGLLDIVGLSQTAKALKTRYLARSIGKSADKVNPALEAVLKNAENPFPVELAKMPVPPQDIAKGEAPTRAALEAAQAERAKLLGDSSGLLDKGQVKQLNTQLASLKPVDTSPEAIKALAKEIQKNEGVSYKSASSKALEQLQNEAADIAASRKRIEDQLANNASAAKNEQRLSELDAEINKLSKAQPVSPTPLMNPLADAISRIEMRSTIGHINPATPGNILSFGNPTLARNLQDALINSQDDELAQAMFGTNRVDALASTVFPQPTTASGTVFARAQIVRRAGVDVDDAISDTMHKSGALNFTATEAQRAVQAVKNDFTNASHMTINDAMSSFVVDGDRVRISAMYGTDTGGFSKAEDAVSQAIISLRKYGVSTDDIKLMGRKGVEFVELDPKNVPLDLGEYYVRVDMYDDIGVDGMKMSDDWSTKWNFFDRARALINESTGGLTRHLFPSKMVIDPIFTKAAARASDFSAQLEKVLLDIANDYAVARNKLSKQQGDLVDSYLKEANFNGIAFDRADLIVRGMQADAIEAVAKWRHYWDNHFYLENYDMVRTLRAQGFQKFSGHNNTELYVKPISKTGGATNVYDSSMDQIVTLQGAALDALYNSGGTLARLRRPTQINGNLVEHVVVRQNAGEYTKFLTDNDRVLNYKNGYFQISYKAPRFIDEISVVNGKEMRRAVAVGPDSFEAEGFAQRMRTQNPNNKYVVRGDNRALSNDSDDYYDLQAAGGRLAQRTRGQLLEEVSGLNHLGDTDFLVDPVTSATRAARSIAGRTISRPFLESSKARVIQKYGHVFPVNEVTKEARWPSNLNEIGTRATSNSTDVKNARTMFEYINYLENGYLNSMDKYMKGMFNVLAGIFAKHAEKGSKAAGKGERTAYWFAEHANISSLAKSSAFTTMIAMNPLRQLVVQPHQAIRMFSYDPKAALKAWSLRPKDYLKVIWDEAGASADQKQFFDFVERSGMLSAVDKHSLVKGALMDAIDSDVKAFRAVAKTNNAIRSIGFDAGERMNVLVHLGTVYERYKAAGKNLLDPRVMGEAHAEARALSYDMNFAGDMPYNQNSLGFLMQFMQVPHKAVMQVFDRTIPVSVRLRLMGADVLMFGGPTTLISSALGGDILPDNPDLREALSAGLEQWTLNAILSEIAQDRVSVDFSSLSPYDMSGFVAMYKALMGGGAEELMSNSAAGSLYLKDGNRVSNLFHAVGRLFSPTDDPMGLTDVKQVAIEAARLASGWTNAEKALLMLKTEKRMNAKGMTIDDQATTMDAVAQALGFGSYDQKMAAELSRVIYERSTAKREEVSKKYSEVLKYYTDVLGSGNDDIQWMTAVSGHLLSMYEDDPEALQIIRSKFAADMSSSPDALLYKVMKVAGYVDATEFKDKIRLSNLPPEERNKVFQLMDDLENARKQMKENK